MSASDTKLLVTGARGFIGRAALLALAKQYGGASIHAVRKTNNGPVPLIPGVTWHTNDLLEKGSAEKLIEKIQPTHCLHAAWEARPPHFWTSPENEKWLAASIALAEAFAKTGGKRFISLGSVAEYENTSGRMIENVTPEAPSTLYGQCKRAFHRHLATISKDTGVLTSIGRIFYVYGPFEFETKLVASACRAIALNEPVAFGPLDLWRDYIHVNDLGRAIAILMESSLEGVVNLATGEPVRQSRLIETLANLSHCGDLFHIGARPTQPHEPPILFADTQKIRSIGWRPEISLEDGLQSTLKWWRAQLRHAA
ncbi:MAG: NAD(P)-dependent oxidoreductase [Alphaproteobacteria bacterium]|nr:NAD(P)-dependent oxidoreductase [Alphaproteobacteria bacterium]